MNLAIDKPIFFIDTETTGLDVRSDRIIELTLIKVWPDGSQETRTFIVNPQTPIPSESTKIHGITDADVADKPFFAHYVQEIRDFIEGCDMGGFNIRGFDLPMLENEIKRAGLGFPMEDVKVLDVQPIYHKLMPRDLAAAYKKYCGKDLEKAHRSESDAMATLEVLEAQLEAHPELPRSISGLNEFYASGNPNWIDSLGKFVWINDVACFNFSTSAARTHAHFSGLLNCSQTSSASRAANS